MNLSITYDNTLISYPIDMPYIERNDDLTLNINVIKNHSSDADNSDIVIVQVEAFTDVTIDVPTFE